jgi:phage N-6-adenine-methyltransferase
MKNERVALATLPSLPQAPRKMPAQRPGLSKQNYATPPEFIAAVKHAFNVKEFTYDLAAEKENTKAVHFFSEEEDSLSQNWSKLRGALWLNPPYADIATWAAKCLTSRNPHSRIFFLVPASVGANWWAKYVHGHSGVKVYFLNGRISFDGKAPYPKDCVLIIYTHSSKQAFGYALWRWQGGELK